MAQAGSLGDYLELRCGHADSWEGWLWGRGTALHWALLSWEVSFREAAWVLLGLGLGDCHQSPVSSLLNYSERTALLMLLILLGQQVCPGSPETPYLLEALSLGP